MEWALHLIWLVFLWEQGSDTKTHRENVMYKHREDCWEPQELGGSHETDSPLQPTQTAWSADTLISSCFAPKLWENAFPLFETIKFVALCFSSTRKLIQCIWEINTTNRHWKKIYASHCFGSLDHLFVYFSYVK